MNIILNGSQAICVILPYDIEKFALLFSKAALKCILPTIWISDRISFTAMTGRPGSFRFTCTSVSAMADEFYPGNQNRHRPSTTSNSRASGTSKTVHEHIPAFPAYYFTPDKLEVHMTMPTTLKGGIWSTLTRVTTVSSSIRGRDSRHRSMAEKLEGLMQCKSKLTCAGIVNGT